MNNEVQTTYGLLVRSEEKARGIMETVLYLLLGLSVLLSIAQFVHEQNQLPRWLVAGIPPHSHASQRAALSVLDSRS